MMTMILHDWFCADKNTKKTCHSYKLEGMPKNLQFQNQHNYYKLLMQK